MVRGFHWESPPFVWVHDVRLATKFPRLVAEQIAQERGGTARRAVNTNTNRRT